METPPNEGRRTRSALAEIPSRLGQLTVNEATAAAATYALPPTPNASPDELVIRQRGRRAPAVWSPDPKAPRTPRKEAPAPGRGTPRKRLVLDPVNTASPAKSPKRARQDAGLLYQGTLREALIGLTHDQVAAIVANMVAGNAALEESLLDSLPAPDVGAATARLAELARSVCKSAPASRLTSRTDSPAFARAAPHLAAFKRCLLDSGRALVRAQCPSALASFALAAWAATASTPRWDNPPHNAARRACLKALAAWMMHALRRLPRGEALALRDRLEECSKDNEDIVACIQYVESLPTL